MLFIHASTSPLLCGDNNECRGLGEGEALGAGDVCSPPLGLLCVEMEECEQELSNLQLAPVV